MAYIEKYSLTSGGAAYTLEVGFLPDTIEVWNYTKWETDATKVKFYWHKDMTDAYALSELCEDTSANRVLETSNGFTPTDTISVTSNSATVTAITQAANGQVTTSAAHGFAVGDKVRFRQIGGMTQLNDVLAKIVTVPTTTTFTIDVNTSGYDAFAAGSLENKVFDISKTVDASGSYRVTLGSTVMGADGDLLFVECRQADNYSSLGDIDA